MIGIDDTASGTTGSMYPQIGETKNEVEMNALDDKRDPESSKRSPEVGDETLPNKIYTQDYVYAMGSEEGGSSRDDMQVYGCCHVGTRPAEVWICPESRLGLKVNPVVFFCSLFVIWYFVGWCADDPEQAMRRIGKWQDFIVGKFTWLYIGSVGGFGIFCIYLCFSKYGDIVLGPEGKPPRFPTATWFSMLFSAGVGIGLFFYGVTEPVWHYVGPNRWSGLPRYERAIMALNVSWFHWGLAPSACYCVVGLPLAFLAHRKGLPMAMRSIFYPFMGDAIKGPLGDIIDIFAVFGTMFGVATSLGLGVMTISTGLNRFGDKTLGVQIDDDKDTWVMIIWIVTAIATVSVVTGLDVGIRRLSEGNFILGLFVLLFLALVGNTWYLLDLFVEVFGNHVWYLTDLEFHTDPFAKSDTRLAGDNFQAGWMGGWTIFYWGWWISWSPFVGVFIAEISKGRTVREFIIGNMFVPTLLTSLWMIIYGGLGLEMELSAEHDGIGGNYYLLHPETKIQYQVPYDTFNYTNSSAVRGTNDNYTATVAGTSNVEIWVTPAGNGTFTCKETVNYTTVNCTLGYVQNYLKSQEQAYDPARYDYMFNQPLCSGPVNEGSRYRLGCRGDTQMLWDLIYFYPLADMEAPLTLLAVITYFVTSSDSGSHVIDMLSANGITDPPVLQRIFWAVSEGAVAHTLMDVGGEDALGALQTASIAAGLPFCIIMIGMVFATIQMFSDWEKDHPDGAPKDVQMTDENGDPVKPERPWNHRLLKSVDESLQSGLCCCLGATSELNDNPDGISTTFLDLVMSWMCPCVKMFMINNQAGIQSFAPFISAILFFFFVLFECLEAAERGFFAVGWLFFFAAIVVMTGNRTAFRLKFGLAGNPFQDCCQVLFCLGFTLLQEEHELVELTLKNE